MEDPDSIMKLNNFIKVYIGAITFFALEDLICFGIGKSHISNWIAIPVILLIAGIFTYFLKEGLTGFSEKGRKEKRPS